MSDRKRHFAVRTLAHCLPGVAGEALKKRGFGEFRILNEWDKVVGPHLARYSSPIKIVFDRGKSTEGVLHIRVASAMAPEFQHLQPLILERIAAYFGYRAVARLVLLQAHNAAPPARESPAPAVAATEAEKDAIESVLSGCDDADLRRSLQSLAQALFPVSALENGS